MTLLVVVLALLWGAYFISYFRSRSSERVDSVARFNRHLSVLERVNPDSATPLRTAQPSDRGVHRISSTPQLSRPAPVATPQATNLTLNDAYRRRRTILGTLAMSSAVTIVGAVLAGGVFWPLTAVTVSALAAYIILLARAQRIALERKSKVHYLTPATTRVVDAPIALTSRSAHSG